jgi:hypothetical protein
MLLLLLACAAPKPAPEPASAQPAPEPAVVCEGVVADAAGAVDLATVPATTARPRRIDTVPDGFLATGTPPTGEPPPLPFDAEWPPVALAGGWVVVRRLGNEVWLAGEGGWRCVGRTSGYVPPFFVSRGDGLVWTAMQGTGADRDWEIHWSDPASGADRLVATVDDADMVLAKPVPGEDRIVVSVRREASDATSFYDVPRSGPIRRIGPEVPTTDGLIGPGAAVVFAVEPRRPAGGAESPPPPDDDDDRPACDPEGCPAGACGWFPDGCGGRMFCGACPEAPGPTTRGGYAFGLYLLDGPG